MGLLDCYLKYRSHGHLTDRQCQCRDAICQIEPTERDATESGFTIIELAIVLLVIAITAAFSIPPIVNYTRMYRLGVGAQNISTALQRARYLATLNNSTASIQINDAGGQINILQYTAASGGQAQNAGVVTLPPDITISSASPRNISFDGRGTITPLPTQSPVIEVDGAFGYFMDVTVSPTGQVTVTPAAPIPSS
ncbi:MAG TPA: prepilin-type N-terminal cleavage/methylation domain-containing protein [Blastocatellia bacterium]